MRQQLPPLYYEIGLSFLNGCIGQLVGNSPLWTQSLGTRYWGHPAGGYCSLISFLCIYLVLTVSLRRLYEVYPRVLTAKYTLK